MLRAHVGSISFQELDDNACINELTKNLRNVRQSTEPMFRILNEMEAKIDRAANHLDILLRGTESVQKAKNNIERTTNRVSDLIEYCKMSNKPVPSNLLKGKQNTLDQFLDWLAKWNRASTGIAAFDFEKGELLQARFSEPVTEALDRLICYFEKQLSLGGEDEASSEWTKPLSLVVKIMRDSGAAHGVAEPD